MQKILLLITSFNSLSQTIYVWLKDREFLVDVIYIKSNTMEKEIKNFNPDIILCPFLQHYISANIYTYYPTFVFHPGLIGDRGAYSIEWALWQEQKQWGGVWLKANKLFDGGDIYAFKKFDLNNTKKSTIYRNEMKNIAVDTLTELFDNIKKDKKLPQILNPIHDKFTITIDWQKDITKMIIKKINTLDSFPGVKDKILGIECYLFGAWEEEQLKGNKPKTILAKRDGAICLSTIDGAVWITHLKEKDKFKLPATYVLKDNLKGIKENRLPLIFDRSYKTFYEISCDIENEIAYLHFNFLNGAFRAEQCIRLKYAIEYLKEQVKVIVLMGGEQFFSNGINLNILEDSKKSGEDGWSNINAINDLIQTIIFAEEIITVASVSKNAGAGGVFLATACDFVVGAKNVVLNPHYKTIGLSGSEYHTYTLQKRVGKQKAQELLNNCLPISIEYAKKIGLVDIVFKEKYKLFLKQYCKNLLQDDFFDDFIWNKQNYLEENKIFIESFKEKEITVMYPEFWEKESIFHTLRKEFVYKICPTQTPKRLKYKG